MAAAQADSEPPPPALVPFDPTSAEDLPTLAEPEREALLAKMRDWNYGEGGVFQRDAELGGHALYHTTAEGIRHFDLCNKLSIEPAKLHRWILAVERCMQPDRLVPYHNAVHVCDVVHAAWWFLAEGQLAQLLTPRATLAVLLAACAHDTGHPGLNNNWWADRELGRVYHGRSPLENFHIRQALELMRHPDSNPLDGLGTDGDAVRKYMIDAILDTDLVYHNRCCEQFKQKLDRGESFSPESEEDQSLLVNMCLKTADIANPAKSWEVYSPWIDRLFREFYAQAQQGFISYLMRPLLTEWSRLVPQCKPFLDTLDVNMGLLKKWEREIEAERAGQNA